MNPTGVFIVLEGTDGSGKGTQFALLEEKLVALGHEVEVFDFPQYDQPSSYFVREYLNGKYGTAAEVGPYTCSLFYALDRYEAAPRIKKALSEGKVVLANRYTGSNMAHQGAKFLHPEERRGYFLWLDSLEFQMLGIPRPTLNIVLRVPAHIAQSLVDKKASRSYTTKKRDIHESDLAHLEQSVAVYDDLCQLFPKDFWRLDCVRSNALLPIEAIHDLIVAKVQPLLPEVDLEDRELSANTEGLQQTITAHKPVKDTLLEAVRSQAVVIEQVSSLMLQKIENVGDITYCEMNAQHISFDVRDESGKYRYHTPANLDDKTKKIYVETMDHIFETYSLILQKLVAYVGEQAKDHTKEASVQKHLADALRSAQELLPIASTAVTAISGTQQQLQHIVNKIFPLKLDEAMSVASKMKATVPAIQIPPAAKEDTLKPLADDLLNTHFATVQSKSVELISLIPRNELDLINDILYEYGATGMRDIITHSNDVSYNKKAEVLEQFLRQLQPEEIENNIILKKISYAFDIVAPYQLIRELQREHIIQQVLLQPHTPRYGFTIPKLVEAAGLSELYEDCFDSSLALHSKLQAAGFKEEAAYATLHGHIQRWQVSFSGANIHILQKFAAERPESIYIQEILGILHERHPILTGLLLDSTVVNPAR